MVNGSPKANKIGVPLPTRKKVNKKVLPQVSRNIGKTSQAVGVAMKKAKAGETVAIIAPQSAKHIEETMKAYADFNTTKDQEIVFKKTIVQGSIIYEAEAVQYEDGDGVVGKPKPKGRNK